MLECDVRKRIHRLVRFEPGKVNPLNNADRKLRRGFDILLSVVTGIVSKPLIGGKFFGSVAGVVCLLRSSSGCLNLLLCPVRSVCRVGSNLLGGIVEPDGVFWGLFELSLLLDLLLGGVEPVVDQLGYRGGCLNDAFSGSNAQFLRGLLRLLVCLLHRNSTHLVTPLRDFLSPHSASSCEARDREMLCGFMIVPARARLCHSRGHKGNRVEVAGSANIFDVSDSLGG
mmetsp:Transcript_4310/g.8452  ORF Transcript_4310/g.8452 Transcript_4310/m.8452 type:complete len:227 (+) Transcript_4310:274-954(+)